MFTLLFLVLVSQEAIKVHEVLVVFLSLLMIVWDAYLIDTVIQRIKKS